MHVHTRVCAGHNERREVSNITSDNDDDISLRGLQGAAMASIRVYASLSIGIEDVRQYLCVHANE
jgi:hypothetical protein